MRGNSHVRFGGGPLEKGLIHMGGNWDGSGSSRCESPRWRPTQHLYRLPTQWVDYDTQRRRFARTPLLPASALPAKEEAAAPPAPAPPRKPAAKTTGHPMPASGAEFQRRLYDYDARLASQGICQQGELVKHVVQAGVQAGYDSDLATWSGPAIALAAEQTKAFEAEARRRQGEQKDVA
jgi:hypothetical protein